jgi:hypothetical protein
MPQSAIDYHPASAIITRIGCAYPEQAHLLRDRPMVTLATINLSGVFADVAKVQVEFENAEPKIFSNDDSDPQNQPESHIKENPRLNEPVR